MSTIKCAGNNEVGKKHAGCRIALGRICDEGNIEAYMKRADCRIVVEHTKMGNIVLGSICRLVSKSVVHKRQGNADENLLLKRNHHRNQLSLDFPNNHLYKP